MLEIQVLSSAISYILASFLRWDALSFNISSSESNFQSKKILKCSAFRQFQNTNINIKYAGWMSGQEIERMMN